MIDWITSNPIDGLIAAAIAVVGGSYLPWGRLKALLPTPRKPVETHTAAHKLLDVIAEVRSHGHTATAAKLAEAIPAVISACCEPVENES